MDEDPDIYPLPIIPCSLSTSFHPTQFSLHSLSSHFSGILKTLAKGMGIVLRIRRLGLKNQFYPNYSISLGMCLRYFQVIFISTIRESAEISNMCWSIHHQEKLSSCSKGLHRLRFITLANLSQSRHLTFSFVPLET